MWKQKGNKLWHIRGVLLYGYTGTLSNKFDIHFIYSLRKLAYPQAFGIRRPGTCHSLINSDEKREISLENMNLIIKCFRVCLYAFFQSTPTNNICVLCSDSAEKCFGILRILIYALLALCLCVI